MQLDGGLARRVGCQARESVPLPFVQLIVGLQEAFDFFGYARFNSLIRGAQPVGDELELMTEVRGGIVILTHNGVNVKVIAGRLDNGGVAVLPLKAEVPVGHQADVGEFAGLERPVADEQSNSPL